MPDPRAPQMTPLDNSPLRVHFSSGDYDIVSVATRVYKAANVQKQVRNQLRDFAEWVRRLLLRCEQLSHDPR